MEFWRSSMVMKKIGYGRSTLYQLVKDGRFPAPIKLGARAVAWSSLEVEKWMAERMVASGKVA